MQTATLSKKVVSVLLSLALIFSFTPTLAFAENSNSGENSAAQNTVEEGSGTGASDNASNDSENQESNSVSGNSSNQIANNDNSSDNSNADSSTGSARSNEANQNGTTDNLTNQQNSTSEEAAETNNNEADDKANSWRFVNGEQIYSYEGASTDGNAVTSGISPFAAEEGGSSYATWYKSNGITSYTYKARPSDAGQNISISGAKRVGIDVSYHNGVIDWAKVKNSGVSFAIIRCGYGDNSTDKQFLNNVKGALENGIDIGLYLYSYAETPDEGFTEAQNVMRLLNLADLDPSDLAYPIFYDLEDEDVFNLSAKEKGQLATNFCSTVSAAGYEVGIYSNLNWWSNFLTDPAFDNSNWHKWAARYPGSNKATSSGVPGTEIWQFSDCGHVDGINGNVDMNFDYVGSCSKPKPSDAKIAYRGYLQKQGWQNWSADGQEAGEAGNDLRLEGIKIELGDSIEGSVRYKAHVQSEGWQDWVSDGELAGSTNQSKRMEAIAIELSGKAANNYDIYYRAYAQGFGWLGWAKNGESAGTTGYAYRLEAIEIQLVPKGNAAPGLTTGAFKETSPESSRISYSTHAQTYGWQAPVNGGYPAGTVGEAKRLEAIKINLGASDYSGSVQYRTHVQTYGWEDGWKSDGELSGTSGEAKRLEAIQIKLTGDIAQHYDVYYRVHAQKLGWLGWAKNGESAGTTGYAYRLEAIEIQLVPKGNAAPGSTDNAFRQMGISYSTHVQTYGWQDNVFDGATSGTTGEAKRLEAIKINLGASDYSGSVQYRTHVQTYGWEDGWKSDGELSGTSGEAKRLEAIQIKLTGDIAQHYDVYYRVHAQKLGWLGWAKNGESAGTTGYAYRLEAIEIQLVPKGNAAPGSTDNAFRQK